MVTVGDRLSDPDDRVWIVVAADHERDLFIIERTGTTTERIVEPGAFIGERGRKYRPITTEGRGMNLLEWARILQDENRMGDDDLMCWSCGADLQDTGHEDDCKAILARKLVAVLEAAEQVAKTEPTWSEGKTGLDVCVFCSGFAHDHESSCPHRMLVAALTGES